MSLAVPAPSASRRNSNAEAKEKLTVSGLFVGTQLDSGKKEDMLNASRRASMLGVGEDLKRETTNRFLDGISRRLSKQQAEDGGFPAFLPLPVKPRKKAKVNADAAEEDEDEEEVDRGDSEQAESLSFSEVERDLMRLEAVQEKKPAYVPPKQRFNSAEFKKIKADSFKQLNVIATSDLGSSKSTLRSSITSLMRTIRLPEHPSTPEDREKDKEKEEVKGFNLFGFDKLDKIQRAPRLSIRTVKIKHELDSLMNDEDAPLPLGFDIPHRCHLFASLEKKKAEVKLVKQVYPDMFPLERDPSLPPPGALPHKKGDASSKLLAHGLSTFPAIKPWDIGRLQREAEVKALMKSRPISSLKREPPRKSRQSLYSPRRSVSPARPCSQRDELSLMHSWGSYYWGSKLSDAHTGCHIKPILY